MSQESKKKQAATRQSPPGMEHTTDMISDFGAPKKNAAPARERQLPPIYHAPEDVPVMKTTVTMANATPDEQKPRTPAKKKSSSSAKKQSSSPAKKKQSAKNQLGIPTRFGVDIFQRFRNRAPCSRYRSVTVRHLLRLSALAVVSLRGRACNKRS